MPGTKIHVSVWTQQPFKANRDFICDTQGEAEVENPPVAFQLQPGQRLRLRFVDDSGKPVPEVGVGIAGWRGGKSLYNHKHPNVLDTEIPDQADENGVYEWNWAPSGQVEYNFSKQGYRSVGGVPYIADNVVHEVRLSQ